MDNIKTEMNGETFATEQGIRQSLELFEFQQSQKMSPDDYIWEH